MRFHFVLCLLVSLAIGLSGACAEVAAAEQAVSFNDEIRPLFAKHCVACHGGVKQASGLSFIYRDRATAEADSGMRAIVPGNVDESYLVERVSDPDPDYRMPPPEHGPALTQQEINLLKQWIEQGANWEEHWAFVPPRPQTPPKVKQTDWPRDDLDRFLLARMEREGLQPAREANRAAWLRRVTLDLTGLPPTAAEYAAFEANQSPNAYEHVVDALLASPAYGERWASMWLDLARYADTQGFEKDPHRDIWPYRDWLIRAFNADMPFDQFTIKQLAGDLLPNATLGDRLATAFHRNTQTNTEGGTDDEEFRTSAVIDRVNTTWQVFNATTFRCTQCHSHPYDPIEHDEYYKFLAFFNTTRDIDIDADYPRLATPSDPADWPQADRLDDQIRAAEKQIFAQTEPLAKHRDQWNPLPIDRAESTGQTKLLLQTSQASQAGKTDEVTEVRAVGTLTAHSTYTLESPLPAEQRQLTALRIDALPKDLAAAIRTPEMGFVVSELHAYLVDAKGNQLTEIEFADAFCDEPHPMFDPAESLKKGRNGWGNYTKMSFPRHAVFVARRPVEIPPGSRLRLTLKFDQTATGDIAECIQRGQFFASQSDRWTKLLADRQFQRLTAKVNSLKQQRWQLAGAKVPVMERQPEAARRRSFVFIRGNWLDKGDKVAPGIPKLFGELESNGPSDRLAMARWLVSDKNPLTARVMVNRLWEELFGYGIVETVEDFGTSGTLPVHPELLDHLALRFQDDYHWSIKRLLRDIVLSATYRQSSHATEEEVARDRQNRLLSRGPRQRLTAEMVRDQALSLSGKLSDKRFGKPVMPPQPEGIWRSVYNGAQWEESTGEDRYRRAIYTYWKRTSGYPSMITFDMPSREVCSLRRLTTNTPLQALVTLNDEAYVELAEAFAARMAEMANAPQEQIAAGYRLAIGRDLAADKLTRLLALYQTAGKKYDANPTVAGKIAAGRDAFSLTVVANALLNLDELLTR